jgi:hypothetical protein
MAGRTVERGLWGESAAFAAKVGAVSTVHPTDEEGRRKAPFLFRATVHLGPRQAERGCACSASGPIQGVARAKGPAPM